MAKTAALLPKPLLGLAGGGGGAGYIFGPAAGDGAKPGEAVEVFWPEFWLGLGFSFMASGFLVWASLLTPLSPLAAGVCVEDRGEGMSPAGFPAISLFSASLALAGVADGGGA